MDTANQQVAQMLQRVRQSRWIAEEDGAVLGLIVNCNEYNKVLDRLVTARMNQFGVEALNRSTDSRVIDIGTTGIAPPTGLATLR